VDKIKREKFGVQVGKSVILCQFIKILSQITDNDRFSRRIRSDVRRQGAVSSPGRVKKTVAGRGSRKIHYQQGLLRNVWLYTL
jgi:hypothetical protein